jgi:hypothetical protein
MLESGPVGKAGLERPRCLKIERNHLRGWRAVCAFERSERYSQGTAGRLHPLIRRVMAAA